MGFQIYQLEKAQAMNLLDRVAERMLLAVNESNDMDLFERDMIGEAADTVMVLYRDIERKTTQLDQPMEISLSTLAGLVANYDASGIGTATDYFARYFSNYNTYPQDFKLAAGESLPGMDELLREVDGEENWLEA